jgi:hypothetical protein
MKTLVTCWYDYYHVIDVYYMIVKYMIQDTVLKSITLIEFQIVENNSDLNKIPPWLQPLFDNYEKSKLRINPSRRFSAPESSLSRDILVIIL